MGTSARSGILSWHRSGAALHSSWQIRCNQILCANTQTATTGLRRRLRQFKTVLARQL